MPKCHASFLFGFLFLIRSSSSLALCPAESDWDFLKVVLDLSFAVRRVAIRIFLVLLQAAWLAAQDPCFFSFGAGA